MTDRCRAEPIATRVLLTVALVSALVGCNATLVPPPGTESFTPVVPTASASSSVIFAPSLVSSPTQAPTNGESPSQLLARLTIAPEHRRGYDRDLFPVWTDDDGDGCNTRYEVLIAEAVSPPAVGAGCQLTGGSWFSTYDGVTLDDSRQVEIDHVVALAEAWYSGAYAWTTSRREAFANDVGVPWTLTVSSHSANQSKGSDDPAEWIPPRAADVCSYVSSWMAIKVRWGLTIDQSEHDALEREIHACPESVVVVPRAPA